MKITTAWAFDPSQPDEMPWLVSAYDEYTEDTHGGVPAFHTETLAAIVGWPIRECVIEIDEQAFLDLFTTPLIVGTVSAVSQ